MCVIAIATYYGGSLLVCINSGYNDDGEGLYSGGEESGSGASGSGDDMKEGDEGDVGTESELAECVDVLHREDDEGDELTSSTTYTAAMCSVLCMDSITNSQPYQVTCMVGFV